MVKITKEYIHKVQPPVERAQVHWDDRDRGYGIRVSPKGRKVFIVMGRVKDAGGDAITVTIGPCSMPESKAREVARTILYEKFRNGIDPREEAKAKLAKGAEDAALRTSLRQVMEGYVRRPGKLKASTAAEYRRHVEQVFASWCDQPIVSITRDMVKKRHAELVSCGLSGKKAAPASANASFVTLRILFNFAADEYRRADGTPLILHNPVSALKHHWAALKDRSERNIDRRKVGNVWNRLLEARREPRSRDAQAGTDLTIFCLLTGCRRMEGAALEWSRVNLDEDDLSNCWWHLPNPKNGKKIWLPLPSQAVALLFDRKPADDAEDASRFVFPSGSKAGHIMDARATMEMVSDVAGKHLSLHDLRRTWTNVAMRECQIEHFRASLLTNHKVAAEDVTVRHYLDTSNLAWLQPEVQKVGDWIEEQAAIAAGKNVIAMQRAEEAS